MLFSVHDWETTGLTLHPQGDVSLQPCGIEFAGLITDGVEIFDTYEFICNPGLDVEPIITKITGLTNEYLREQPRIGAFTDKLAAHFGKAECAISHNLSFDRAIARAEATRQGKTLADFNWPRLEACSVEQTSAAFGRYMKLQELFTLAFGPYTQKHRAMDDVMCLHKICQHYGIYTAVERMYSHAE